MLERFCILVFITAIIASSANAQNSNDELPPQPKLISAPTPVYPKEAKDARIGGRITVRVVVDAQGAIVSVDNPTGPPGLCGWREDDPVIVALRNSVIEASKGAKFEPAMKDGKPVKSVIYFSSTFNSRQGEPASDFPRTITGGVLNGKAKKLPKPEYPRAAHASNAAGAVSVQVLVDESGNVLRAEAVSGHSLLRSAAVTAACKSSFSPTTLDGKPVRVSGILTYNFIP